MRKYRELDSVREKWCLSIVNIDHVIAFVMVLAHVLWYVFAWRILAKPREEYLRDYIILPALYFFVLNLIVRAFGDEIKIK